MIPFNQLNAPYHSIQNPLYVRAATPPPKLATTLETPTSLSLSWTEEPTSPSSSTCASPIAMEHAYARVAPPKRPSPPQENTNPDQTSKKQRTEPAEYADLLELYKLIKKDVQAKYSLPGEDTTLAPWVSEAMVLLDHAEREAMEHGVHVTALDEEIERLQKLVEQMRRSCPLKLAVGSVRRMMWTTYSHDVEGKKIVEDKISLLGRGAERE
ncbi:hypothetical protein ETB97_010829 [Aspergillus alliaceus]|uniref:Uncharacterized protein n=1 Tax=Petromyces alliaceus TaxID=209559 RepID=A0A5N6FCX0_PETAA|nr:uncharacterized protein BDW43DRAFT_316537 [Aspergillus alliaceus]KAB8227738.1 hypothetical protein BDW43DRAFT_316537 [Aspergillus alliaceus]KAE8384017.1 hypothetical protein BDV23DRAFT_189638 [Aspergillus alliaceus]KAF5863021.1 hypothetical protein ETB97_010829 [Aspergillus burnettii]